MISAVSVRSLAARCACLALAVACAACPPANEPKREKKLDLDDDPLAYEYDDDEFEEVPQVLARVRSSPFAYFRYIAGPFAAVVCKDPGVDALPTVNLHGDAHLEQYAVADDGFGIVDFDDATLGPPTLDWLRFTTSVWLSDIGGEAGARGAIARFVDGYERALDDPEADLGAVEPAVARRIRASVTTTPTEWLDAVTGLTRPMADTDKQKMEIMRAQYVRAILTQNPDLAESFFAFKGGGPLSMGVGSAHESKFLVRVEGPTPSPSDDVILERKEMNASRLGRCTRGKLRDPRRVIDAQSRFSRSPQRLLGYISDDGTDFYVHAWRVHYTEVSVRDIRDAIELGELAYDFGLQLGRGHPRSAPGTDAGNRERASIKAAIVAAAPRLGDRSRDLAMRTKAGFAEFKRQSEPKKKKPKR